MKRLALWMFIVLGCHDPDACTVTQLETTSAVNCGDDVLEVPRLPAGTTCVRNGDAIACDNGRDYAFASDTSNPTATPTSDREATETPFGGITDPRACRRVLGQVMCLDGTQVSATGIGEQATCRTRPNPGVGQVVVCTDGESRWELEPEESPVTCAERGQAIVCTDGTILDEDDISGCDVEEVTVARNQNEDLLVLCAGVELLVIEATAYCRDVWIESQSDYEAFLRQGCTRVYGDLTLTNIHVGNLTELGVERIAGRLAVAETHLVELNTRVKYVESVQIADNDSLSRLTFETGLHVEGSVEVTGNDELDVIDANHLRWVDAWVISGNQGLEQVKLPEDVLNRMSLFMLIDNASLRLCEVEFIWLWAESMADSVYVGNNGPQCT